jgi:DNA repair protein RadA/Sms
VALKAEKAKKSLFVCSQCGKESVKWTGRCPNCNEWNSLVETAPVKAYNNRSWVASPDNDPTELSSVETATHARLAVHSNEFNRVLGGGLVPGSLILIGGDPGIGKSTLLLQVSAGAARTGSRVVYVSGEESLHQIKLRAERLGLKGDGIFLLSETNIDAIIGRLDETPPNLAVVDSVQTIYADGLSGTPGSITQIRECTLRLMSWAKKKGVPVMIIGHVTKDGAIAGPRVLEHIVDVVLYFEGEAFSSYRVLRSVKNRFGSTNEVGVFEMSGVGLVEVDNPSQAFLSQHYDNVIGSIVVPTLEGSRPLLVEIQSLTNMATFGPPRRLTNGVDFNRLLMIAAVLTRRAGVNLSNQDIMVNVTGGIKVIEPAADLGIALAIASSFRDTGVSEATVALGELGLSGELRVVPQLDRRIAEAERMGFRRCLVPRTAPGALPRSGKMELIPVNTVGEALRFGLRKKAKVEKE